MTLDTSFLRNLNRFSLILQHRSNARYQGGQKSIEPGSGLVLKDYQQYVPGDDVRRIDWKVWGRTDKYYVKRYEEERNLTVHIILDFSGSMRFGKPHSKAEYASQLGLGFAYMALRNNERFVLSTFSEKLDLFKPKKGMKQIAAIVDYLSNKKPEGKTSFEMNLKKYFKRQIHSRSMVVIISDFLYDSTEIEHILYRYKDHEVTLIQVLDTVETSLDLKGDFKLVDAETKAIKRTFISPFLKRKYKERMDEHQAAIKKMCGYTGAKFYVATTGDNLFDVFYSIMR